MTPLAEETLPGKASSGDQHGKRLKELLIRVAGREEVEELGAVIELLKKLDEFSEGQQREVLGILHSFRALPPSAQDRLLPVLTEVLRPPQAKTKKG
jgi:hypothetical protein